MQNREKGYLSMKQSEERTKAAVKPNRQGNLGLWDL